jgi:hypothetical protein
VISQGVRWREGLVATKVQSASESRDRQKSTFHKFSIVLVQTRGRDVKYIALNLIMYSSLGLQVQFIGQIILLSEYPK